MHKKILPLHRSGLLIFFLFSTCLQVFAQNTVFKSSVDDSLSIHSVAVAPAIDNMSGIYARPLSAQLLQLVEDDRRWAIKAWPQDYKIVPENIEENSNEAKAVMKKLGVDALLTTRISKGPLGIAIYMNLFTASEGFILAQETLKDYAGFEISDLQKQQEILWQNLINKIPYVGVIMSRKAQMVTINAGSRQGLRDGKDLSVVQILKINRHPKFHFIISTEKEIIGRVHLDKVDDSISFASVTLERSAQVIQPGMKLIPIDFIEYSPTVKTGDGALITDINGRADKAVSVGSGDAQEWRPTQQASLGSVAMMVGLGTYNISNTLNSAGGVNGSNSFTPSAHIQGELWLTTDWFLDGGLRQYISSVPNNYSGSKPDKINVSTTETKLLLGHNFLLNEDFWGPRFQVLGGYSKITAAVDDSSPSAYTSISVGGFAIGLGGSFPLEETSPISLGARLLYFYSPSIDETPLTSGSSSSGKWTSFSAFGTYKWTSRMNLRGELIYDLFGANFSGSGSRGIDSASTVTHQMTTLTAGVEYLF